ncbi:ABC transporter ATP-binding protein [Bacillus kwashiorkori]|uniref:ABC transporter ATP-binding protein n=1 Tax=Bacillus kwashiorkori TaxID=1522318 RepID=UPI00078470C9|nr:ABC transporter ATP-binding protein [Bacillus kwashiorkori]
MTHAIKIENITKYYRPRNVVDHVSFHVNHGEIFGLLGKNGAGKSTIINMITGISFPTSGNVFIYGKSNSSMEAKKRMGVMPDYDTFYSSLTALDHLVYFSKLNKKKISKHQMIKTLERVGLGKDIRKKVKSFSFGMKKKLGIAQAIITNPDLIILDEPTSGLDAESVITIQHLLRELNEEGKTIFMTSHNLDEVEKLCTKVAILNNSRLMSIGTLDQLKKEYQSNIIIHIKHLPIKLADVIDIKEYLQSITKSLHWNEESLNIVIQDDSFIPMIIKTLVHANVDIMRMETIEPSLEDIFLSKGGSKTSDLVNWQEA